MTLQDLNDIVKHMRSITVCAIIFMGWRVSVFAGPPGCESSASKEVVSSEFEPNTQTRLPVVLCDTLGSSGPFELNSGGPFLINKKNRRMSKRPRDPDSEEVFFQERTSRRGPSVDATASSPQTSTTYPNLDTPSDVAKALEAGLVPKMPEIPEALFICLKDIYIKLVPFCLKLREYANERPDKQSWPSQSFGPGYLRYWATYLEVVQDDVGNSIFLSGLKDKTLNALLFLSNEDTASRLKTNLKGAMRTLKEHSLLSEEISTIILSLLHLADQLISSTKKAQELVEEATKNEIGRAFREGAKEAAL